MNDPDIAGHLVLFATTERLLDWQDHARKVHRDQCSDVLLMLAWAAYERQPRAGRAKS